MAPTSTLGLSYTRLGHQGAAVSRKLGKETLRLNWVQREARRAPPTVTHFSTSTPPHIIKGGQGRNSSRNLEAGTETEPMRNTVPWLTSSGTPQAHLSRDGKAYSGLGLLMSIVDQNHAPQTRPRANLMVAIPELRSLFQVVCFVSS